ncbi:hypothetical protein KJ975_06105, partial [Myxococcota bacterium]|nr:hypothetical protein [Myxococcota bacterium]
WTLANQPSSLLAGFIRTDDIEKLLIYEEIESISISISISTWHFAPRNFQADTTWILLSRKMRTRSPWQAVLSVYIVIHGTPEKNTL